MTIRSENPNLVVVSGINPGTTSANATSNGTSVDLGTFPGASVGLVGFTGTRTDGTYTFKLQDSADNATFADVAPFSGVFTAIAASNAREIAWYLPTRRYVRAVLTSASVTTGSTGTGAILLISRRGL